jgi:hypothetical protein
MDRHTIRIDPATTKLRRVGRLARRRMRIDGESLRNGVHTDGTVAIRISGLGAPVAGVPVSFQWKANRSIELVIVRAGVDGEDVRFHGGPARSGTAQASLVGDGSGIRYVAFCYDAPVTAKAADPRAVSIGQAPVQAVAGRRERAAIAGDRRFAPTHRDRRSILSLVLPGRRLTGGSLA